ncbi:MAG: AI-2E family transporter [Bryobacteraceae bacterium]|nr:AI-2E family transporter [Bryobacteraceae bacterium]
MSEDVEKPKSGVVFLLSLAGLLAVLVAWLIKPFLEAIFLALILSFTFQPLFVLVRRRVKSETGASLLTLALIVILVLTPLSLLVFQVSGQAVEFFRAVNARAAGEGGVVNYVGRLADKPLSWAAAKTGLPAPELERQAQEKLEWLAGAIVGWAGRLASNVTATLGTVIIALFTLFFLYAEGARIRLGLYQWLPMSRARVDELMKVLEDSIVANVYSMAAVGAAQGILTGLGFLIAGLPSPLMWGLVAGVFSLIPLVGSGLIWLPGVAVLLFGGSYGKALFLLAWGALLVANADNVIRPWVLSGRTNMNTMVLLFALLGGMHAFDFMGLFAGPVIVSVAAAVFRILREELSREPAANA